MVLQEQNKNQFLPTYHNIPKPAKSQYVAPISISNELAVLRLIQKAAEESLNRFPNNLDYDKTLLKDQQTYPPYSNQRNVIIMRAGEKEVLHKWLDLTRAGHIALQMEKRSSQKFMSGIASKEIQTYLKSVTILLGSDAFE
jgi:hypothetical protein